MEPPKKDNKKLKRDIDEDIDGSDRSLIELLTVVNSILCHERKIFRELKLKIETVLNIAEDIKFFIMAERDQKVSKRDIIIVEELLGNLKKLQTEVWKLPVPLVARHCRKIWKFGGRR